MKTASEIIEAAGGSKSVAHVFDVQPKAVVKYARLGKLPASWFDGLEYMTGKVMPRSCFTFKEVAP